MRGVSLGVSVVGPGSVLGISAAVRAADATGRGSPLPAPVPPAFYSLFQDPLVLVVFVLVGGAAVVAVERRSDTTVSSDDGEDGADEDPLDPRRRAVGDAVGRMADALAGGDDTFRAWTRLAAELGVEEPETADADDLRSRAVAAGLAEADADRLADQFDVLRYGGAATDRREREAIDVLRDLEAEYAGDSPAATADA